MDLCSDLMPILFIYVFKLYLEPSSRPSLPSSSSRRTEECARFGEWEIVVGWSLFQTEASDHRDRTFEIQKISITYLFERTDAVIWWFGLKYDPSLRWYSPLIWLIIVSQWDGWGLSSRHAQRSAGSSSHHSHEEVRPGRDSLGERLPCLRLIKANLRGVTHNNYERR